MTLVTVPHSLFPPMGGFYGAAASSAFTFDGASDLLAVVFIIPKSGTVNNIHYRVSGVSSPSMTHRIGLQTVSATTGLPTGTLYSDCTAVTVAASGYSANTNYTAAINCAVTAGDLVALVFDLSAFTSGSFTQAERTGSICVGDVFSSAKSTNFPYTVYNSSGSTAKSNGIRTNCWLLEYSSPSSEFVPIAGYYNFVGTGIVQTTTNVASAVTRIGNIFTPLVPRRATGMWCALGGGGSVGDCLLRLRLDSDKSILATCTIDGDQVNSSTQTIAMMTFDSGTTVTLAKGTAYLLTLEGNSAGGAYLGGFSSAPSNSALGAMPGGVNCYEYKMSNSVESYTTTSVYTIGLITDQEDDGTGGGGGGGRSPIQGLSQQGVSIF